MRYVGTKDEAQEFATQADVGTVYVDSNELAGSPEGHMWYDEDEPDTAESGFAASATKVQAGLGLAGGGDLTVDRTLMIDFAPSGVVSSTKAVRADDSRLSGAPASHTHSAADINAGTLALARMPAGIIVEVQYTTVVPARPTAVAGAPYVKWVGGANPTASMLEGDTWVSTNA